MLVGKHFLISCRHVFSSKRLPFRASLQTFVFRPFLASLQSQVCKVKSAKNLIKSAMSSLQTFYWLFEVCRLTFQSLPTNIQKFLDLPCRIILFTKTSLQSQVCKVKSAKSSLQSQVCKHLWSKCAKSSLQTLGKLVGKLTKEFADLLERVTDLTLQSCIKYLQTNFEKLVCKHVKKNPRHDVGVSHWKIK